MGSEDRLAVVSFGDRTIIEQEPSDQATETPPIPADQQHSRLNDGLEAALSLIPPTHPGRILVVSDGHWTGRDPNAVTARAASRALVLIIAGSADHAPRTLLFVIYRCPPRYCPVRPL